MALDKLTIINNGGLSTTSDYRVGVLTATKFVGPIEGAITSTDATFTGNVSIGGTLTYEDVTNIDSVGVITARDGIHVGAGVSAVGVGTFGGLDIAGNIILGDSIVHDGDTDTKIVFTDNTIDFQTAGASRLHVSSHVKLPDNGQIQLGNAGQNDFILVHDGTDNIINCGNNGILFYRSITHKLQALNADNMIVGNTGGSVELYHNNTKRLETSSVGVSIPQDLDVDGHTNLDNVSIAGITTFSEGVIIPDNKALSLGNRLVGSTAGDLRLYHDTNNSYIDEIGSGNLYIRNNTNNSIFCQTSGKVELYYNGNDKLATTNTGVSVSGTLVAGALDISGDIDVDGHTNLDNVNIAGVTTSTGNISVVKSSGVANLSLTSGDNYATIEVGGQVGAFIDLKSPASDDYDIRFVHDGYIYAKTNINLSPTSGYVVNVNKNLNCAEDLDVDGHTNLDNVSIAGVTTAAGDLTVSHTGLAVNIFESTNNHSRLRIKSGSLSNSQLEFADQDDADAGEIRYDHGNDRMTFHVGNNVERLRITSGGQVNIGGDYTQTSRFVNINGGSTIGQLQLKGTEADLWLHSTGVNGQWRILGSASNNTHAFRIYDQTNSAERLRIKSNGHLGIANTSPLYRVDIGDGTNGNDPASGYQFRINSYGDYIFTLAKQSNASFSIRNNSTSTVHLNTQNGKRLALGVSSGNNSGSIEEHVNINSSGSLIVGSSSYGAAGSFSVGQTGTFRQVLASGTAQDTLIGAISGVSNGFQITTDANNDHSYRFHNGINQSVVIDSDGDVSIGSATNSGSNRLQIVDSHTEAYVNSTDSIFRIINENTSADTNQASISFTCGTTGVGADSAIVSQAENSSGNTNLQFWTDTSNGMSEKLRIDSRGRVGINKFTHADIASALTIQNGATGSEHSILDIVCNDNETSRIYFSEDSNTAKGSIRYVYTGDGNYMSFYTNGTAPGNERLRITSGGIVNIGVTSPQYAKKVNIQGDEGYTLSVSNQDYTGHDAGSFSGIEGRVQCGGSVWSNATIKFVKHNGTSGDKKTRLELHSTNGFSTNAGLVVQPEGYVTKPETPAFFVSNYGGSSISGDFPVTNWNDAKLNNGSHFKTSGTNQGYFIVPISGMYHFHANGFFNNNDGTNENVSAYINRINDSGSVQLVRSYDRRFVGDGHYGPSFAISCTVQLTKDDKVGFGASRPLHGNYGYFFGGYLIG